MEVGGWKRCGVGGGKLGQDATMGRGGEKGGRKRTSRKAETFSADKNLKMAEASGNRLPKGKIAKMRPLSPRIIASCFSLNDCIIANLGGIPAPPEGEKKVGERPLIQFLHSVYFWWWINYLKYRIIFQV